MSTPTTAPEPVRVRTGEVVPRTALTTTMVTIRQAMRDPLSADALAVLTLVEEIQAAPGWQGPSPAERARLREMALVQRDGSVHDVTRAVLLAAFEGPVPFCSLVDPVDRS